MADSDSESLQKIADLKKDLGNASPDSTVTNGKLDSVVVDLKKAIKEGKSEQKSFLEAIFEASGLKELFESFKQEDAWSKTILVLSALGGVILGKLLDLGKLFNLGLERLSKLIARKVFGRENSQGHILASGESGLPRTMTRQQADSLTAVSINPHGLTQDILNGLKDALKDLVPEIQNFNNATRNMYSSGKINKLAKAIGNLKNKLNPNPAEDIKEVATAIGELNGKLQHYAPQELPKPRTFKDIASAAKDLNQNADTLRRTFAELASASNTAAGALGAGAAR